VKSICLILYTHQPIILKNYRFYDIGKSSAYFNEASNKELIQNLVKEKFTPVNKALMKIFQNGSNHFKISFSFSGTTLDLLENSSPEMIRDLKKMNEFGYVEFLSETYSNSILSKNYQKEFLEQTKIQKQKVLNVFGQIPKAFLNVSGYPLPFLSSSLPDLGFNALIQFNTLHSKSPGSLFYHFQEANVKPIKILQTNKRLLNQFTVPSLKSKSKNIIDIESFLNWVKALPEEEDVVCIALDYSNLISGNSEETFLLDFVKNLPKKARKKGIGFCTPSELLYKKNVMEDKARPTIFEGLRYSFDSTEMNVFQKEIFDLLIDLKDKIYQTNNKEIVKTWFYLQDQGLFKKMEAEQNPESEKNNAIQFYITYRNVLNDFTQRVEQSLLKGDLEKKHIPIELKNYPDSNSDIFNVLF
jgi:alpha-amylase